MTLSISTHVAKERLCPRSDCDGWVGTVTYIQEGHRTPLPVIESCAALCAFVDRREHEHCPLTQGAQT